MRNDLIYCQSSIVKNAPPRPNMVAIARLLQPNFEDLIVIKTNISCIGCKYWGSKAGILRCNENFLGCQLRAPPSQNAMTISNISASSDQILYLYHVALWHHYDVGRKADLDSLDDDLGGAGESDIISSDVSSSSMWVCCQSWLPLTNPQLGLWATF